LLALIPARGGSKGLPGKNLRSLGGMPLIAHSIQQALNSSKVSRVAVSTDCPEIAKVALDYGAEVPFLRPLPLATDVATSIDVLLHAAEALATELMVLLQPTSPLRLPRHIDEAIGLFERHSARSVVSCSHCYPLEWMFRQDTEGCLIPVSPSPLPTRRQDTTSVYVPNGSIYVVRASALANSRTILGERCFPYLMSDFFSVDIDTLEDFAIAEALFSSDLYRGHFESH